MILPTHIGAMIWQNCMCLQYAMYWHGIVAPLFGVRDYLMCIAKHKICMPQDGGACVDDLACHQWF